MMPKPISLRHRGGFTLLELMVAWTLGMLVMGLAISAYQHTRKAITRAEALLRLHSTAGDIGEQWERDANCLLQHVACNSTTTYSAGIKLRAQFTGMAGQEPGFDNQLYDYPHDVDFAWFRWEWNAADRRLSRAESPPPHWVPWYSSGTFSYLESDGVPPRPVFGMRCNPLRTYAEFESGWKNWTDPLAADPSIPSQTRIYDHLFLTGVDVDGTTRTYGGFADELNSNVVGNRINGFLGNMSTATWSSLPVPDPRRTLANDVTDCSITVITRNGTVITDFGSGFDRSIDGQTQDGLGVRGDRPDLLRLTFTLTDRSTGLNQVFTFSAKAP
jgi:type II secretory pathway pseudopilin PulG